MFASNLGLFRVPHGYRVRNYKETLACCGILSASSKLGYVFIGTQQGLVVSSIEDIKDQCVYDVPDNDKDMQCVELPHIFVQTSHPPLRICLSPSERFLAVGAKDVISIFATHALVQQVGALLCDIQVGGSDYRMAWNSTSEEQLVVLADCNVYAYNVQGRRIASKFQADSKGCSVCCSPKEGHIALGYEQSSKVVILNAELTDTLEEYELPLEEGDDDENVDASVHFMQYLSETQIMAGFCDDASSFIGYCIISRQENVCSDPDEICAFNDNDFPLSSHSFLVEPIFEWQVAIVGANHSTDLDIVGMSSSGDWEDLDNEEKWRAKIVESSNFKIDGMLKIERPLGLALSRNNNREVRRDKHHVSFRSPPLLLILTNEAQLQVIALADERYEEGLYVSPMSIDTLLEDSKQEERLVSSSLARAEPADVGQPKSEPATMSMNTSSWSANSFVSKPLINPTAHFTTSSNQTLKQPEKQSGDSSFTHLFPSRLATSSDSANFKSQDVFQAQQKDKKPESSFVGITFPPRTAVPLERSRDLDTKKEESKLEASFASPNTILPLTARYDAKSMTAAKDKEILPPPALHRLSSEKKMKEDSISLERQKENASTHSVSQQDIHLRSATSVPEDSDLDAHREKLRKMFTDSSLSQSELHERGGMIKDLSNTVKEHIIEIREFQLHQQILLEELSTHRAVQRDVTRQLQSICDLLEEEGSSASAARTFGRLQSDEIASEKIFKLNQEIETISWKLGVAQKQFAAGPISSVTQLRDALRLSYENAKAKVLEMQKLLNDAQNLPPTPVTISQPEEATHCTDNFNRREHLRQWLQSYANTIHDKATRVRNMTPSPWSRTEGSARKRSLLSDRKSTDSAKVGSSVDTPAEEPLWGLVNATDHEDVEFIEQSKSDRLSRLGPDLSPTTMQTPIVKPTSSVLVANGSLKASSIKSNSFGPKVPVSSGSTAQASSTFQSKPNAAPIPPTSSKAPSIPPSAQSFKSGAQAMPSVSFKAFSALPAGQSSASSATPVPSMSVQAPSAPVSAQASKSSATPTTARAGTQPSNSNITPGFPISAQAGSSDPQPSTSNAAPMPPMSFKAPSAPPGSQVSKSDAAPMPPMSFKAPSAPPGAEASKSNAAPMPPISFKAPSAPPGSQASKSNAAPMPPMSFKAPSAPPGGQASKSNAAPMPPMSFKAPAAPPGAEASKSNAAPMPPMSFKAPSAPPGAQASKSKSATAPSGVQTSDASMPGTVHSESNTDPTSTQAPFKPLGANPANAPQDMFKSGAMFGESTPESTVPPFSLAPKQSLSSPFNQTGPFAATSFLNSGSSPNTSAMSSSLFAQDKNPGPQSPQIERKASISSNTGSNMAPNGTGTGSNELFSKFPSTFQKASGLSKTPSTQQLQGQDSPSPWAANKSPNSGPVLVQSSTPFQSQNQQPGGGQGLFHAQAKTNAHWNASPAATSFQTPSQPSGLFQTSFSNSGALAPTSGPLSVAEIRQQLIEILSVHNPENVAKVDHSLNKHKGNEMELLEKTKKKYGISGTTPNTSGSGIGMSRPAGWGQSTQNAFQFSNTSTPTPFPRGNSNQTIGRGFGQTSPLGASSNFGQMSTPFGQTAGGFGQPSALGRGGGSGFGQASSLGLTRSFGQNSPQGQSTTFLHGSMLGQGAAFGQTSTLGQSSGFGQTSSLGQGTAFGQTSALGSASPFATRSAPTGLSGFGTPFNQGTTPFTNASNAPAFGGGPRK